MEFNGKSYIVKNWSGEKISSLLAFDTETTIQPFTSTPDMVLGSAYGGGNSVYIIDKKDVGNFFEVHVGSSLIFHNAPFDIDVLEKQNSGFNYYKYYDSNRIFDTGVLYRLVGLAREGYVPRRYSLDYITREHLDIELEKGEERATFEQFISTELAQIPANYLEYAAKDAIATYECYWAIRKEIGYYDTYNTLLSHHIQVKGDLALNRIYKRGIGFDLKRRDKWLRAANKRLKGIQNRLATWGWVRGQVGNKESYIRIMEHLKLDKILPRTENNDLSSRSDDLQEHREYQFVDDYLNYSELEKLTTFVREADVDRIHPRYNLLMNTGRTSCTKPNIQQLPRSGVIRSFYTAKEGHEFIITDYSAIELSTLSQVLIAKYGKSIMAEKICEGKDLHRYYASVLHSCDEKDITKQQRQEAKAANFGFPGGLGLDTFRQFSAGYGLNLSEQQASKMKKAWFTAFPEMRKYLSDTVEGMVYTLTGRARGGAFYCAAANTPFQGLAADGAKLALYELGKAGLNVVAFIHDEIVIEEKIESVKFCKEKLESIMISAMKKVVPDVKVGVESQVSRRYCK